ncbi:MaoC family dehydratase [soil metagenome]
MTTAPATRLVAEQIETGTELDLGEFFLSADDVIDFATKWDPQAMHTDAVAAVDTSFGGLIASGIHTLSVFQRLVVLGLYSQWDLFAGRRLTEVRFLKPVFADSTLRGSAIIDTIEFNHPHRALVTVRGWISIADVRVLDLICETYVNRAPVS